MTKNKIPEIDGFSVEFYKFFWIEVKHLMLYSLDESLTEGDFSVSQRQGIIMALKRVRKGLH